ncbi:S8 family peptidase [Cellulomonas chitinilytica]|nr:S8/S53 family peptidase [Cellulomonas chitinilytica]
MDVSHDGPGTENDPIEAIVALEHLRLVQRLLARHEVRCEVPDERTSVDLGLALLQLAPRDADHLVASLPPVPPDHPGYQAWAKRRRHGLAANDDDVLTSVRASFEGRYAGWVPTLGKNRLVGSVSGGGGSVSHGGGEPPTRAKRPASWRLGTAGDGMSVGILDTALFAHPDLAGGYRGNSPRDVLAVPAATDALPFAAGHATFVAGLILDRAPGATVRVRGVLDDKGNAKSWDVATAIVELGRTGIQILNLSLVCYTADNKPPLALSTAVDRLPQDVLVIACAGNHGDPRLGLGDEHRVPSWPAALDDVVAVGSAMPGSGAGTFKLSPFTPQDAEWIDVLVAGEGVTSTYFTGHGTAPGAASADFEGWARWEGTSFSAAVLSGEVAARASARQISPRAAYAELRPALQNQPLDRPDDGPYLPPFLPL